MSASDELLDATLTGQRTGRKWTVIEKLAPSDDGSLGHNSCAYFVVDENNQRAFLKASDLGMFVKQGADTAVAMQLALTGYIFERDMLEYCHGNNMDRVVTALDHGVEDRIHNGARDPVYYLIFEEANGDLRRHVRRNEALNLYWAVTTLHNIFVAASQLHTATIAHNDIKPANTLVFTKDIQKIADLGRATSTRFPIYFDKALCAGDKRFAPPEQLYPNDLNCEHLEFTVRRRAGDLYNLGSLTYFMLSGRTLTSEIIPSLRPEHRPANKAGGSHDSYQAAIPYWQEAFSQIILRSKTDAIAIFGPGVEAEIDRLITIVVQLGQPDPLKRGHPKDRNEESQIYGLNRYISSLDAIKSRLFVKSA